jgi:Rps23 Pro-64 3,4-dihydroxylase Tpa1-like proline 4-hydroxylase
MIGMNMPELKVINQIFKEKEIGIIKKYSEEMFKDNNVLLPSKSVWDYRLNISDNEIKIYRLNKKIDEQVYDIIVDELESRFEMKVKTASFCYYLQKSYINWHNDMGHSGAATIYLNEKWDKEDGGFFVYELNNNLGIEIPKFNKCVFQKDKLFHATTPTSSNAPIRKILQVFFV